MEGGQQKSGFLSFMDKGKQLLPTGHKPEKDGATFNSIEQALVSISQKLDIDMAARQRTVELQEQEIKRLHLLLESKNNQLLELNKQVTDSKLQADGSRQLMNKLLNDIERLQQDVEWYKRTYETRSLLGTLKQKLFGTALHKKQI